MVKKSIFTRIIAFTMAMLMLFSLNIPVQAETIGDGDALTVTVKMNEKFSIMTTDDGVKLNGYAWEYTTDTGIVGPAYCINWGLKNPASDKKLTIAGKYTASPKTIGAFAGGYPQRSLEDFIYINVNQHPILANLTREEYASATQIAVWATLGQIAVEGTSFTTGRATLSKPTDDEHKMRVYEALEIILLNASEWSKPLVTGMHFRLGTNEAGSVLNIEHKNGIAGAEADGAYGIKKETINGVEYYTREMVVSSATSTFKQAYEINVFAENAPEGTIFTSLDNKEFETIVWDTTKFWRVPNETRYTSMNENGQEYYGDFKICIPVRNAPESCDIKLHGTSTITQYDIYLANNTEEREQSFILADPMYAIMSCVGEIKWAKIASPYARLVLNKTDGMGNPLQGAIFELTGSDGSTFEGVSNARGVIIWEFLNPDVHYTVTEVQAPEGYIKAESETVIIPAGQTMTLNVKNHSERSVRILKVDAQNGNPLIGATFRIEQTDGSYKTDITTTHSGVIELKGDELPFGSYKVYEVKAPEGYEKDSKVLTFDWNGKKDVLLTFENVREPSLVIVKMDSETCEPLEDVKFKVYKDGKLVTSVITDNAGYARAAGLSEGYYEVEEVAAPEGYITDTERHGIYIDPYNPATDEDPVLVITNDRKPHLIIEKLETGTMEPLEGIVFSVYKDAEFIGEYTTDRNGLIELENLDEGTYTIKELLTDSEHVLDEDVKTIELAGGKDARVTFFNKTKPDVKITKIDTDTGEPLEGALFRIEKIDGTFVKECTTDKNGKIELYEMDPGAYRVSEIAAPEGYILNDDIKLFEATADKTVEVVFKNSGKPSLIIEKLDYETLKPMAGTVFAVYKDTTLIGEYTTDKDGLVEISDLEIGTYTVKEIATDSEHLVQGCPQSIELVKGRESRLIFFNKTKPGIEILKIDVETKAPLQDAVFSIEKLDGSYIKEFVTDKDGRIDLTELELGAYSITEVYAPEGYIKNTENRTFEVVEDESVTLVFTNTEKPDLKVYKIDADTKEYLYGAVVRISNISTGQIYDKTTDSDGEIRLENIDEGIYSVQEISAPEGYLLNSELYHITLKAGRENSVVIPNSRKPSLTIKKFDSLTGTPMKDTKFAVYLDTVLIGEYATDKNGEIYLYDLKTGTYTVTEITTDDGHIVNSNPQSIEITKDSKDSAVLVFLNDQKPYMRLVKLDAETMKPLPNAVFKFKKVGGSFEKEYTTDENGEVKLDKLSEGSYIVSEVKAPDGYLIDDGERVVEIEGNGYATFVFTNTKKPSLKILKYDSYKDTYLPGATFRIAKIEDGSNYLDRVTDINGKIEIDNLETGVYSVKEIEAPSGYVLNETEYHVELFGGKESQLVVHNEEKPSLKIVKTDVLTGKAIAGVGFVVKKADGSTVNTVVTDEKGEAYIEHLDVGIYEITEKSVPDEYLIDSETKLVTLETNRTSVVRFKNYPKPSLVINKVDAVTKDGLENAKFHILYASNNKFTGEINDMGEYQTDKNGQVMLHKLKDGWYKITEIDSPDGYALDSEPKEIYIRAGENKEVTFENTPLSGLVIKKVDADTGDALQGAKFRVRYLAGESGTGGTVIGEYTTSANGTIVINRLEAGTYVIEEIKAPDGYIISDAPETVYITGEEQDIVAVEFENKKDGGLIIRKFDSITDEPLSGAEFKVTTSDGSFVENYGGAVSSNGIYTTDKTGQIHITGIKAGETIVVTETKAPDGYVIDTVSQTVKIDANDTQTLTFYNKPDSGLIITKLDKRTGEPLYGAVFKVTASDGSLVGNSNGRYTTDRDGLIHIYGLKTDTYVVTEVEAPEGYTLDSTPQTIKLKSGETHELVFYNQPLGGIRITKLDEETRQPIKNVQFEVEYMNGERVGTYRTNSNGIIDIDELPDGWYTIIEKKAAKGYQLDSEPHDVEVKNGKITRITLTNRKTSSFLIHKVDSITGRGIYGVTFLISDRYGNPVAQYTTDQSGYVYMDDRDFDDGKYYIREISVPEGYVIDTEVKTFYVEYGETSSITWYNTPTQAQIQIIKKSADDNPINGLPKGSLLEGAVFEIYDRGGNIVDTIKTDKNGRASSKTLPLGIYTVRETVAPAYYMVNETLMTANLEFSGQIITFEVLDKSVSTGVSILKTGYREVMPDNPIVYTFTDIANTSSVPLDSFYWRDTLPSGIRTEKLVTGTYNQKLSYKIVYLTNHSNGEYKTLNDNLSTDKNYVFDISNATLNLATGEYITEIMFVFGRVKSGFAQVENPYLYARTVMGLANGTSFVNQADVGGVYNGQWITSISRWVTKVYNYTHIEMPRTGY